MMYYEYALNNSFWSFLALLVIVIMIAAIFQTRKSKQYRREIADMYVVGKIKQIAEADKIDLQKEYESFKNWIKKSALRESKMELDDVIEYKMKEDLYESAFKEKPKK